METVIHYELCKWLRFEHTNQLYLQKLESDLINVNKDN